MLREKQPCASEYDWDWPPLPQKCSHTLSHTHTRAQPRPQSAATHPITIKFCARRSSGPGYRWFILRFIKETGVPLKRDQSATRLEESASNWPFIKKPSQVDRGAEISRVTTEPHYINYTTDEPRAPWLAPCGSREAGIRTDAHTPGRMICSRIHSWKGQNCCNT